MTDKQQRTAYNLTKMAKLVDPLDTSNGLYEIAKDNKLAMIELKQFDLDGGWVFVPSDEWDGAYAEKQRRERLGFDDPSWPMARLARRYRDAAEVHQY